MLNNLVNDLSPLVNNLCPSINILSSLVNNLGPPVCKLDPLVNILSPMVCSLGPLIWIICGWILCSRFRSTRLPVSSMAILFMAHPNHGQTAWENSSMANWLQTMSSTLRQKTKWAYQWSICHILEFRQISKLAMVNNEYRLRLFKFVILSMLFFSFGQF